MPEKRIKRSVGVIQADTIRNCHIHQNIFYMNPPADLCRAITATQNRLNQLKISKGLKDVRLPLGIFAGVLLFLAAIRFGPHSIPLSISAVCCFTIGWKLNPAIYLLDSEIRATQRLLDDYCKLRAKKQIEKDYLNF